MLNKPAPKSVQFAAPVALALSLLAWIFGKSLTGPTLQLVGQILTAALSAGTALAHQHKIVPPVRKVIRKATGKADFTMFDSIDLSEIPHNANAVAGYAGGRWPTYRGMASIWPKAFRLSIAVNAGEDADCLDVENGDATVAEIGPWVERQLSRGVYRPVIYFSISLYPAVLAALRAHGLHRQSVRLWSAHYTYKPHICGPAGSTHGCGYPGVTGRCDATQYTDHALGRNLDASYCDPTFAKGRA